MSSRLWVDGRERAQEEVEEEKEGGEGWVVVGRGERWRRKEGVNQCNDLEWEKLTLNPKP